MVFLKNLDSENFPLYGISGSFYPACVCPLVVYPASYDDYLPIHASPQEWLTKRLRMMFMHCMSKFYTVCMVGVFKVITLLAICFSNRHPK